MGLFGFRKKKQKSISSNTQQTEQTASTPKETVKPYVETESDRWMFEKMLETHSGPMATWDNDMRFALCTVLFENGHPEGTYYLAECYDFGVGTATNHEKAEELYQLAADRGSPRAMTYVSRKRRSEGKHKEALELYIKAAQLGDGYAAYSAGRMYLYGKHGIPKDEKEAFYWYNKGAELGEQNSMLECGECFRRGFGTEADPEKAVYWYEKAVEHGYDSDTYKSVAEIYMRGDGIPNMTERAIQLLTVLSDKGWNDARGILEEWQEEQELLKEFDCPKKYTAPNDPVEECTQGLEELLEKAKQDDIKAQFICGYMYDRGIGTEKNIEQALRWYQKSARRGNLSAQERLSQMLLEIEDSTDKDYRRQAFYWAEQGAQQGSALCQNMTAIAYGRGLYREVDINKAFYWYQKAAQQGYANAQYYCGIYISRGLVAAKNRFTARRWIELAAQQGNEDAVRELKEFKLFE